MPNDPTRYGPLAGKIVTTDEKIGGLRAIDTSGNVAPYLTNVGDAG